MAMKIVIAVMLIDDEVGSPDFYENVAIDVATASNPVAISQAQTWVSEKIICAKLANAKLDDEG